MPGPQFFETIMGARFYKGDVPRIGKALKSIAESLEVLAADKRAEWEPEVSKEIPQPDDDTIPDLTDLKWTEEKWLRFFNSIKPNLIRVGIIPCPANHAAVWNSHIKICPQCGEDVTPAPEAPE